MLSFKAHFLQNLEKSWKDENHLTGARKERTLLLSGWIFLNPEKQAAR
jgi:hypothetical protein